MFSVIRAIGSRGPEGVMRALRDALEAYERTNEAGVFRITFDAPMFHVYPAKDAAFDAPISLRAGVRSLHETVRAIMDAGGASSGAQMRLGTTISDTTRIT